MKTIERLLNLPQSKLDVDEVLNISQLNYNGVEKDLNDLAKAVSPFVREQVVMNRFVSTSTLELIRANDSDPYIRSLASKKLNLK